MHLRSRAAAGLAAPTRGGWRPRVRAFAPLAALAVAAACSKGSGDQVTRPVAIGMTSAIAPTYMDGEITLYEVQSPVAFPVRKPTAAEEKALGPAPKGTPYPHAPFLTAQDESVEVHFVITNVDTVPHNVWLLIDPWNEFVRWKPGVTVVSDEETLPNNGYDKEYPLDPMSRTEGTITSDDIQEIATKLAAAQNFLASPAAMMTQSQTDDGGPSPTQICNNIFDYQNRSNSVPPDLTYTAWIPPVIAGLTGFDLGLEIQADADSGSGGAGNVAIEITMDVQDLNGDRMVPQDTTEAQIGIPSKTLSPPAARF
jgi:hypothetical protein